MNGDELRLWRAAAGMTQQGLATRLGCSLRTIQQMEKAEELRPEQLLAVDMVSMLLATELGRACVLTDTALKVWLAVETYITPHDRARPDFAGVLVLKPHEESLIDSWVRALGEQPTRDQVRAFILNLRAKAVREQEAAWIGP